MSAATKRNAPPSLAGLDAEARDAVRKAARHAGMSLEEWLAAVSGERTGDGAAARKSTKRSRPGSSDELDAAVAKLQTVAKLAYTPAGIAAEELEEILARASDEADRRTREQAAKTAVALDSVASWIEQAEGRLSAASRNASERQERTAEVLGQALGTMTRRHDDIERKLAKGGNPSMEAALKAVERIEAQLAKSGAERGADEAVQAALRGFESRIAELAERIAAARPASSHSADPRAGIRNAVAEIRARQAELDEAVPLEPVVPPRRKEGPLAGRSHQDVLQPLREDIGRLAGQLRTLRPGETDSREIAGLRSEIDRLQAMVGSLATRDEVNALERSMSSLAAQVASARAPSDIAAVSGPIEALQGEVRRVADLVTTGIHGRLARDIEGLARKIDAVAGTGADPDAVQALTRQLTELRRHLAEMAEPQRVHALSAQMGELNERLAELARRQLDSHALERRFDALARQLDGLSAQPPNDIAERIEALSQKLDRLGEKPRITFAPPAEGIDTLVRRFDRLDEALTRGRSPQLGPIEEMLRTLVDRIEKVGRPGAGLDALDSLEKQVSLLARRLEGDSGDPGLAGLERMMGDLMREIELLRSEAHDAAERAAKTAVADTLASLPKASGGPDLGLLKRDLDDIRTHQTTADKRMQMTLESVHAALEKVVTRLATPDHDARPIVSPPPAAERPQTVRVKAPAPAARPAEPAKAETAPQIILEEADRPLPPAGEEILLEPGAARPRPGNAPAAAAPGAEPNIDVKASFIAAARRAAQAAAAEAAANAKDNNARPGASLLSRADGAKASLVARMKGVVDKHRRPILLGLAAIVLALGALSVVGGMGDSSPPASPPKAESRLAAPAPTPAAPSSRSAGEATQAKPSEASPPEVKPDEPKTTQAVPSAAPAKPDLPIPAAETRLEGRTSALGEGAKAPVLTMPATAAPLQIAPAAPVNTGAIDPRPPASDPIPNMAAVGELPIASGLNGLRHAALAGDPIAVYEMAARLAEGRGYPRDLKLAARLFEKAAANGIVPAQCRIGNHYEKALGVARDIALAKAWYQRAADRGNVRAMHNLAVLLAEGGDGKPDYAAASEWFRKAAEHGVKDSQFNLAVLLARAAADSFKPTPTDRAANEVAVPAQGWAEPAPAPTKKAPASAQRPAGFGKRV